MDRTRLTHTPFKKNKLACLIGGLIALNASQSSFAQETIEEEIIVLGVRGAQEQSIQLKRDADQVVDSITAEDIGKLPDITIADSLQRVTGIQITRSAGQGGLVSVRGMPQVSTTLNGEMFLTAETMTSVQANFSDIPASLVSGIDVYKSQSSSHVEGGIGGTIDLKTRRSLSYDEGLTFSGGITGSRGSITQENDAEIYGLFAFNTGNNIASSLAVSYSDATLASHRANNNPDLAVESSWGCPDSVCQDINGDGTIGGEFMNGATWNSGVDSREFERERLGVAFNFNAELSESLELNADIFYNKMDEKQNGQFLYSTNVAGRSNFHTYTARTGNPAIVQSFSADNFNRDAYVTEFYQDQGGYRGGVRSNFRETSALNTNIELNYNNGGNLTGSLRWVHADGDREFNELTLAQKTSSLVIVREPGGAPVEMNPGAIDNGNIYPSHITLGSESYGLEIDPTLSALMEDAAAWYIHSGWVEGEKTESDFDVVRADGVYDISDSGLTSLEFGLRVSDRDASFIDRSYFSPIGGDSDLLNKFHEAGYAINQTTGTAAAFDYDPLPVFGIDDPILASYITTVSDFGEAVSGLNVAIPMIDTSRIDDPLAFSDFLYGPGQWLINPDRSYDVNERKKSLYFKLNFDTDLNDFLSFSGDVGLRYIKTDLKIRSNLTDSTQLNPNVLAGSDPNHTTYVDLGDVVTRPSHNHALASMNLNFGLGDEWKVKFAYNDTTSTQDLQQLGSGIIDFFNNFETDADGELEPFQRISSRQHNGNPNLDPWEAGILSLATEWYPTDTTLVSLGYFYMDIESFTFRETVQNDDLVDSDGVARRGAPETRIENGEGGNVSGWEFAYQQSFDFLPSVLGNTGLTFNYTYSPSKHQDDQLMANGKVAPFGRTAKNQSNLILWYQDDAFQMRIAGNYLSKQFNGIEGHWSYAANNGADGLAHWFDSTLFVDFSASYEINDNFQVLFNVANLTEENKIEYAEWKNYVHEYDIFERRTSLGVRFNF